MRKKILFISRLYPRDQEDKYTTRALHDYLRFWKERADVLVMRPRHYNPLKKPIIWPISRGSVDGIEVHTVAVMSIPLSNHFLLAVPLYFLASRKFRPDIVVSHRGPEYLWSRKIAKRYGAKFVIGLHGSDVLGRIEGNRRFYESADLVACRSPAVRAKVMERCPSLAPKCIVASSGVASGEIIKEEEFEKKAADWEGHTNFVTASKLLRLKNIDCVIESLAGLAAYRWTYTIIGDGPERARLERLAEESGMGEKIRFLGQKTKDEVLKALCSQNVFLMPSAPETFGLAYLEAMAKGCIPVCARGWGIDGIIENGRNGFTVDSRSVEGLRRLLEYVLGLGKTEKLSLLSNIRKTILDFTEERVANEYLDIILALQ